MTHILYLALLGAIAGTIAGFWTRIIKADMILSFVNDLLYIRYKKRVSETGIGTADPLSLFLRCVFCLTPWCAFILDACYIIIFTPAWYLCIIGVFASLGAGNLVAEIIYALRGRE